MRILLLGDSNDTGDWVAPEKRKHRLVSDRLAAELGEPVEIVVRSVWPDSQLPAKVGAWIAESEPDVIYLNTGSFYFLYRSVPLRVKRLLGRVGGEKAGDAGFRVAKSERWGHNAVFRGIRHVLQQTIGGDTHFTREQVFESFAECVRIAARAEDTVVVVKGPHGKATYNPRRWEHKHDNRERLRFHRDLQRLCEHLHVTYDGVDDEHGVRQLAAYRRGTTAGDGLHANEVRHEHEADVLYTGIRKGLEAARRVSPVPDMRTTRGL